MGVLGRRWGVRVAMVENLASSDPREIGPYRLLARLGRGSFGTVYAARRGRTDRLAAVKVARSEFSDVADFPARFSNEIEAIERVKSDFVPELIEAQADGNPAWMATELIPGPSLDLVVGWCGPLPEEAVRHLGAGIVEALTAIHACGLVHRDLRPKNVLLVPTGPWVIDFNLAHLVDIAYPESFRPRRGDYGYMAPEEGLSGLAAAKMPADVFALGATLVFAATGHAPFDDRSPAHLTNARPNLNGLPTGLSDLVARCLLFYAEARPSLDVLRQEFDWHTGGSGHDAFTAALPPEVVGWLTDHRDKLAGRLGTRGLDRLGWGGAGAGTVTVDPPADTGGSPAPGAAANRPGTTYMPTSASTVPAPAGPATAVPVRWTSRFGSWISGAVAVAGTRLAVTCLDGTVAVLRTANGKAPTRWREPVNVGAALHAGAVLRADGDGRGTAYVGAADGRVHAIDLASGQDRVVIEAAAAIEGAPVLVDGRVCALSADGHLHAMDPRTGERTVLFRMGAAATGSLAAASGTIFGTDTGGRVYAIDATAGGENWQVHTDGLVLAAPLPAAAWLYVCGTDGALREIGIADGNQRATAQVGAPVHVAPVRDGNLLYVGSSDGMLHAFDIGLRGRAAWQVPLGEEIAGLAASGGRVYVATGDRLVEVEVDSATKHPRELLRMDGLIGAPPAISGRHCYVTGLGGVVTCLALS